MITTQPVFEVHITKHVGLLLVWFTRTYTFRGTYAQCGAELARAQRQNKLLGWWSIPSLFWNAIALAGNSAAAKSLARDAAVAFGHPSAMRGPMPAARSQAREKVPA
ncbi:hypothetical protein [Mycolicibacterium confluentis]|uniref:Uncharacterized protein n=1 Tax=Mycolicibacterium confluentis TaxID=28047 RepID=A0A7I7XXK6_9MYCO|nr:hypothetical protein [Mycolicibacterium confluentis]MCV7318404.1 hypothetical protein [Mycolicibacterium confluentis]BBZ34056.1 hypothetical protein MCNF_26610 [Mycolicibacterium confluentis]